MFENVNERTDDGRTDNGRRRTPDPWVSYKLTSEPSAQVSLKVGSILLSACSFVRLFVPPFKKKIQARVLKFHIWIPHKNSLPVFFCLNYLPLPSYAPFKG